MKNIESYSIRREQTKDFREVEELTRNAFWNLNVPGCNEHYLVHIMRDHPDFIPELDLIVEENGTILRAMLTIWMKLQQNNLILALIKWKKSSGRVRRSFTFIVTRKSSRNRCYRHCQNDAIHHEESDGSLRNFR